MYTEFYIRLKTGYALLDPDNDGDDTPTIGPTAEGDLAGPDQRPMLHIKDLIIGFYDINGAALTSTIESEDSKIEHRNTAFPDGRNFKVTIASASGEDLPSGARYMTVLLPAPRAMVAATATAAAITARTNVSFTHAEPTDVRTALIDNKVLLWNKDSNALRFELVNQEPTGATGGIDNDAPKVVSIVRTVSTAGRADQQAGNSIFGDAAVSGPFGVRVTFTEQPNFAMDAGNIKIADLPFELENAKITGIVKGTPFYLDPPIVEGNYPAATDLPDPSGRDSRFHPYLLTVTPDLINANDVVIRVKPFNDLVKPANQFSPPSNLTSLLNRSVLRVSVHGGAVADIFKTNTDALAAASAGGTGVFIGGGLVIPSGGYLVLARGAAADSGVRAVGANKYKDNDDRARADNLTEIDFKYNVVESFAFPAAAADLQNFFRNGGTISLGYSDVALTSTGKNKQTGYHGSRSDADLLALVPSETIAAGSVVINEIMWGRDGTDTKSQWIELHNTTAADISIDASEWALTFGGAAFGTVIDSVGNNPATGYWAVPGASGNTAPTGNQSI